MFAYCLNNPDNYVDFEGDSSIWYYLFEVMQGNNVWEIKHGGSDAQTKAARTQIAQKQALWYVGGTTYRDDRTVSSLGEAGAFGGYFTITIGSSTYMVTYETPDKGSILYYAKEADYYASSMYVYAVVVEDDKTTLQQNISGILVLGAGYAMGYAIYSMPCRSRFSTTLAW